MKRLLIFCVAIVSLSCEKDDEIFQNGCSVEGIGIDSKINGGSILQTWMLFHSRVTFPENIIHTIDLAQKTNADWISLSPLIGINDRSEQFPPFKYDFPVSAEVEKMKVIIPKIINSGLHNIMLKPLTSFGSVKENVSDSGFWGDFYVDREEVWQEIERAYAEFFYEFAKLSEEFPEVKLLSIGNELKEFSKRRPQFFKELVAKIRADFPDLKLTYAANWDEYQSVSFWEDLDYIGVNPYFPLLNEKNPNSDEIKQAFAPIKSNLNNLSCTYNKPILFTEYGFRSVEYGLWESWLREFYYGKAINFEIQSNAYKAFYDTFWDEDWVAGGFFWEWKILFNGEVNNPNDTGWSVKDKPVEEIIRNRYSDQKPIRTTVLVE